MNSLGKAGSTFTLLNKGIELMPNLYFLIVQLQNENLIALYPILNLNFYR